MIFEAIYASKDANNPEIIIKAKDDNNESKYLLINSFEIISIRKDIIRNRFVKVTNKAIIEYMIDAHNEWLTDLLSDPYNGDLVNKNHNFILDAIIYF